MNSSIGTIIATLRYQKKYSRMKLCRGLCSTQMLLKIEHDEADVDKFMSDILLQRLGKSPDKLEIILSDEEYQKIYMRDKIEELIWKKKRHEAMTQLKKYEELYAKDSRIQKMFVLRTKSYISRNIDNDIKNAERYIRQSIEVTLPEITSENMNKYLLSGIELENIFELVRCLLEQEKPKEAETLLDACQKYMDVNITDAVEYTKLNSKSSWLYARIYIKKEKYMQAYQICESAIEWLRKYGILYFMLPLFEQLLYCTQQLGMDINKNKWNIYYGILKQLYSVYGKSWYCQDSLFHNCVQTSYHLASEFIRQERQAQELTQEQLIEGIYESPENLSRVEHAKVTPSRKKFEGLMQKLGFERGKYSGSVIVENFEMLELKYEIDILVAEGNYEEAQKKLNVLSENLDDNKKWNELGVAIYQIIIEFESGKIEPNTTYKKLTKILKKSMLLKNGKLYRVPFFNELIALNTMCSSLRKMNRLQERIAIYNSIIEVAEQSKIELKYQNDIMSSVLANANLFDTDENRCHQGISYELSCGKGKMIYMHFLAQIKKDDRGEKNRQIARIAYYMSDLFYRKINREHIKNFYEETYGETLG